MTDLQFTNLARLSARMNNRAYEKQREVESEYERRYGEHPSDVNDDGFIDACMGGCAFYNDKITAQQIHESALIHGVKRIDLEVTE